MSATDEQRLRLDAPTRITLAGWRGRADDLLAVEDALLSAGIDATPVSMRMYDLLKSANDFEASELARLDEELS